MNPINEPDDEENFRTLLGNTISRVRCSKSVCDRCEHLSIGLNLEKGYENYYCQLFPREEIPVAEGAILWTVPQPCPYILEHALDDKHNEPDNRLGLP